jgi:hypothetical protein
VVVTGWQDGGDASLGGGYFIIKNSWGTGGGYLGGGYYAVPYNAVTLESGRTAQSIGGPAYYNGSLNAGTRQGTGSMNWNTSTATWNIDGVANQVWKNGETAATFNTAGGTVTHQHGGNDIARAATW